MWTASPQAGTEVFAVREVAILNEDPQTLTQRSLPLQCLGAGQSFFLKIFWLLFSLLNRNVFRPEDAFRT